MPQLFRRFAMLLVLGLSLSAAAACSSSEAAPAASDGDTESDARQEEAESDAESAETELVAPGCPAQIEARPAPMNEDKTFDLGPYIMHTTQDSTIIKWRTLGESGGKVVYGQGDALDQEALEEGKRTLHEVTLRGLRANTRYAYKVVSDGVESAVHHLYSAPGPEQGLRFVVGSDSQAAPTIFRSIVTQMASFEPFLLLHVGDTVQSPKMSAEYDPFKSECYDVVRPLVNEIPFYVAIGNHEAESSVFYDLVSYPGLQTPQRPTFESFYSFRYGNTFFLVVNTNTLLLSVGTLADFIRREVASKAAQSAKWRIALAHYPGYSDRFDGTSCIRDGYPLSRDWLLPLLGENKFHVYFSGHAHTYQRGQANKVLTMVTGGLGGGLDEICQSWETIQVRRAVHHHIQVTAGCQTLSLRAIDTEGREIDHVTLDATRYGELLDAGVSDPPAK